MLLSVSADEPWPDGLLFGNVCLASDRRGRGSVATVESSTLESKGRSLGATTTAFLGLLAIGVGCGCELVLGDLPSGETATGSTTSSGTTGGGGSGGESASTSSTGGAATTTSASTTSSTTSSTETACCDCDDDGHPAIGACGGDDCDDDDPTTHPGADYQTAPAKAGGYDHDCSKTVDPDPDLYKVVKCGLVGLPCDQKQGFLNEIPPCGEPGDWGTCQGNVIPCSDQVLEPGKRLACK